MCNAVASDRLRPDLGVPSYPTRCPPSIPSVVSFVPQAEHLRCRRDEQRREALWLRRLDLLEQALAQERELLTPLADEVRSLREDAGRLHSQLQAQEARFYGLERLLQRLERHLERQEDRWQQLPGAALPALLHCRPPREVQ